ncbi:MAG: beta-hydroxyacyl-ACP dehydratase [Chitinispirillaceae bacterium]|nr:beta-hydroxyacyl-ACP dehydratase [Chitinispirillaceae bacterium]
MSEKYTFTLDDILGILPHRPPFLFVDRITEMVPDRRITGERVLRPDEPHFAGHFPGKPIMPGVLVTDALAQTSGLLWGFTKVVKNSGSTSEPPELFYLAAASMKYVAPALPGDTLRLYAETERTFDRLHSYTVEATCGRRVIAKGNLTLAMMEESD